LESLHNLPGVQHAAITSVLPLTGDSWGDIAQVPGDSRPLSQLPIESFRWTSPEYFSAIQLPLLSGRFFTAADWGKNVALISSKTAKALWPGKDPVGRQFQRGGAAKEKPFTVIGVIADARTISLAKPDPMLIYVPYWFRCDSSAGLIVRTRQDLTSIGEAIRQSIWAIDRSVPVPTVRALGTVVADSVANQRFEMQLLLFFAGSALFLAGIGVYGIVSYSVVQRNREIGLRLSLGAQGSHVYRLVLNDGLLPVLLGIAGGLATAFNMARIVTSMLFEISPYDPFLTVGSALILLFLGHRLAWFRPSALPPWTPCKRCDQNSTSGDGEMGST
jgi:ABC-type antimicrobial peptide transport system permease subunit